MLAPELDRCSVSESHFASVLSWSGAAARQFLHTKTFNAFQVNFDPNAPSKLRPTRQDGDVEDVDITALLKSQNRPIRMGGFGGTMGVTGLPQGRTTFMADPFATGNSDAFRYAEAHALVDSESESADFGCLVSLDNPRPPLGEHLQRRRELYCVRCMCCAVLPGSVHGASVGGSNTTLRGTVSAPFHRTAWETSDTVGNAASPTRHVPSNFPQFQGSPTHGGKRAEAAHNPNQVRPNRFWITGNDSE